MYYTVARITLSIVNNTDIAGVVRVTRKVTYCSFVWSISTIWYNWAMCRFMCITYRERSL